ncbi:MAG TPA: hypothetical protein VKB59_15305 [Micromonosporaceae bacterium]|nr:hypothetical protein [Micromonosporaceae bacterium]
MELALGVVVAVVAAAKHVRTCRSCGKPVLWVETANGKRMPVDPEPSPRGNLWLSFDPDRAAFTAHTAARGNGDEPASVARYVAHFVTCPQADDWRRS